MAQTGCFLISSQVTQRSLASVPAHHHHPSCQSQQQQHQQKSSACYLRRKAFSTGGRAMVMAMAAAGVSAAAKGLCCRSTVGCLGSEHDAAIHTQMGVLGMATTSMSGAFSRMSMQDVDQWIVTSQSRLHRRRQRSVSVCGSGSHNLHSSLGLLTRRQHLRRRSLRRERSTLVCNADGASPSEEGEDDAPASGSDENKSNLNGRGGGDGDGSNSSATPLAATAPEQKINFKSRKEMLLEYVRTVQPEFMERFIKRAPNQVVDAMRQTVTNMLGTLPPQFFEVTVSTVGENLAQLMYSVMMTGYMFRNAQYRLDLQQSFATTALPDPDRSLRMNSKYEPGVQKTRVQGEVLRWHKTEGLETMGAVEYIDLLELEIEQLAQQVEESRKVSDEKNNLLAYLKSLEPQNLKDLTSSAGDDALEAMNAFIQRLLGVSDPSTLKTTVSETTASELAKLLYWLMVVGYSIRNIEVRFDMERVLGLPVSPLAELPPGEF